MQPDSAEVPSTSKFQIWLHPVLVLSLRIIIIICNRRVPPIKIDIEEVFMVYEWFSGFKGADVHLVSVFPDDPVHQPHLWPHDPALKHWISTHLLYPHLLSTPCLLTRLYRLQRM